MFSLFTERIINVWNSLPPDIVNFFHFDSIQTLNKYCGSLCLLYWVCLACYSTVLVVVLLPCFDICLF